jgi:phosphatidate cytidylyltransferase
MSGDATSVTARRAVGAMLFVPVVLAFILSQSAAQWILLAIAWVMVWEFTSMVRLSLPLRVTLLVDFALFALPAPLFEHLEIVAGMSLLPLVAALAALVVGLVWMTIRDTISTGFVVAMIACILAARGILGLEDGHMMLLAIAAIVASCDIAAYFTGRRFGGPRLAPAISPNKTRSGAVGGLVAALCAGLVVMPVVNIGVAEAVIGGGVIAVLAQSGDLLESMLKRHLGVKDSGRLIPGHGGFLDRFDGYILTLPAVYLYILAV